MSTAVDTGPDTAFQGDPKQLYRILDDLLDGTDAGTAAENVVAAFLERLLSRLGEALGLVAGAAYEERRRIFHQLLVQGRPGVARPENAPSGHGFPASFPVDALELNRNEPYVYLGIAASAPWLDGNCAMGSGATVVNVGRARFVVALGFDGVQRGASPDLVLHTLRAVLTSHLQSARWGSTMREAAAIQRSLIPAEPPDVQGFDIAGVCNPAEEVGGDFFDALPISATSTGLVIGDASGHGLPAALVTRDVIVGLRMGVDRDLRIAPILEKLNRIIHRGGPSSSFVSLFYGELELNGNLFYVNAGHKAPLLFRAGVPCDAAPETLFSGDMVLGPVPDARFKRQFAHVDRGDCLVLYTDGLNERLDPPGEQFGDARIAETIQRVRDEPSDRIARAVIEAAAEFGQGEDWADDATVLVVKRDL